MAKAKTRIRYVLAVIDDVQKARRNAGGMRYVTKDSLEIRKRDVQNGVPDERLVLGLTTNLAETHLYASEEGAWLDSFDLKLQQSCIRVVKLRIANE